MLTVGRVFVLGVVLLAACGRGGSPPEQTIAGGPAAPPAAPKARPGAWPSTCLESLVRDGHYGPPPPLPPPPPSLPGPRITEILRGASLPLATPVATPLPERLAPLQLRPDIEARLARRIGLRSEPCDPEPLLRLQSEHPGDESLYCAIGFALDVCGQPEQAMAWARRRVADFPSSVDARLALAFRRLLPLWPDRSSPDLVNTQIPALERLAIADAVIDELAEILAGQPDRAVGHHIAALAYTLRALSRELVREPGTPEHLLARLRLRKDLMRAWEHGRDLGALEQRPACDLGE